VCGGSSRVESSLSWLAGQIPGYGGRPYPAEIGPSSPEQKIDFHDREGLTVRGDCEVFVITGICALAGAAALRVWKRSGMRVLGLPPETAAAGNRCRRKPQPSGTRPVGHPGSEHAPYWLTFPCVHIAATTPIHSGVGVTGWVGGSGGARMSRSSRTRGPAPGDRRPSGELQPLARFGQPTGREPPSTPSTWPLTKEASFDARKRITAAISDGCAGLPAAMPATIRSWRSAGIRPVSSSVPAV
jgi:hypothetical protein